MEDDDLALGATQSPGDVDTYIARQMSGVRELLTLLRALVRDALPEAEESIKYGVPFFSLHGTVCYLVAGREDVTLGFTRGASLDDPEGILTGDGTVIRKVRVRRARDIRRRALRAMLARAVEANLAARAASRERAKEKAREKARAKAKAKARAKPRR